MEDKRPQPSEEYSDGRVSNSGYEVVRSQFFSQSSEPAVTFSRQKIWVNSVCLAKFSKSDYIQIIINRETKVLTLYPSQEDTRDSILWCSCRGGKQRPKQLSCPVFWAKIYVLMKWNPAYRYRIVGKYLHSNGFELLAFDLRLAEAYAGSAGSVRPCVPRFPADWRDWFGTPAEEHSMEPFVHIFDEYAVFELEPPPTKPDTLVIQISEGEDES